MIGEDNRKTELLVGLFLAVGLVLLGALILQFSRFKESFRDTYPLTVTFPSASGIGAGSPIRLGGLSVGRVSGEPQPNDQFDGVVIPLKIFEEYRIPTGSVFKVGTDGLMGDALIIIQPPNGDGPGGFLEKDAVVDGTRARGLGALGDAAEELTSKTHDVLEEVQMAIATLNHTIGNLDTGFFAHENADHFTGTLRKLDNAIGKLDADVLGTSNTTNLSAAIADIREAADSLRDASEKLPPVVEKGDLVMDRGAEAMEALGDSARSLQATATEAKALLRELRAGDGLAAALLGDEALREDFHALISNLRSHGVLRYRDDTGRAEEPPASQGGAAVGGRRGVTRFPWQR